MPTSPTPITALPTAPSRADPANFATRADSFLGALSTFRSEANALATNAYNNAVEADADATAAASSASAASSSASTATTKASEASASATAAQTSANTAAALLDAFDDRYLGSKAADPTVDNDGNPLLAGALYWSTTASLMKVYDGSAWNMAYVPSDFYLPRSGGTMTGPLTLSGGTANGVVYLNGSKVATSGSALTYNGTNVLQIAQSSGTNSYFRTTSGTVDAYFGVSTAGLPTGVVVGSFSNDVVTFYQNSSEQMRLTSTGLGIGTSSPNARLHAYSGTAMAQITADGVGGIKTGINFANGGTTYGQIYFDNTAPYDMSVVQQYTTGSLIFGTNSTERARITSGGDFGIGNINPLYRLTVDKDTTSAVAFFTNSNASAPNGAYIDFSAASPNNATEYFLYCEDSTAQRATIRSNGGLANYSANDVNLSDRREKTNFAPAKSYLDTICSIPVQTFEYIDQSPDDPGLTLGVVAQDVQAVAPELVMESNWGTADNPKMRLSIYQTDLQYALMKCIQELKAELDATKARLAALEAQP